MFHVCFTQKHIFYDLVYSNLKRKILYRMVVVGNAKFSRISFWKRSVKNTDNK